MFDFPGEQLKAICGSHPRFSRTGSPRRCFARLRASWYLPGLTRGGQPGLDGSVYKPAPQVGEVAAREDQPASRRRVQDEHRKIVEACKARDPEALVSAMNEHRSNAIEDMAVVIGDGGV